ncbi:copper transporter [Nocardioides sp.]|uniref:copper transporter n=1 Tax=Nocardioides sp. TaxID=35761 RepID=UPI003564CA13
MNRLRRHVVAVVAGLLALAVGIALGGGPLSYVSGSSGTSSQAAEPEDTSPNQGSDLTPETALYADAFTELVAERAYADALLGHPTAILVAPGVDQDFVDTMVAEVRRGGGGLTGVFTLADTATDTGGASLVDKLGSQLVTQLDDTRLDPAAPTYERFGQLLGLAISTPAKGGLRTSESAATIRESLITAELLDAPREARMAPLVLVLMPPTPQTDDEEAGDALLAQAAVYNSVLVGLKANSVGVVALADAASARDGLLSLLRQDPGVTAQIVTVDGAESSVGRVSAVLSLIASLHTSAGAFGPAGADGAPPLPEAP